MTRVARCQCGQLSVECSGDPVRVSVCHCLSCQRRSGSAFAVQARFPAEQTQITGVSTEWVRLSDDGHPATFHFCPTCGSTVYYFSRPGRELVAIPVGGFADPHFPPPAFSVYETRKHGWVTVAGEDVEHIS